MYTEDVLYFYIVEGKNGLLGYTSFHSLTKDKYNWRVFTENDIGYIKMGSGRPYLCNHSGKFVSIKNFVSPPKGEKDE